MISTVTATQRLVSVAPRSVRRAATSKQSSILNNKAQSRRGQSTVTAASDNELMEQLMAMLGGGAKGAMVDEKDALPGRQ